MSLGIPTQETSFDLVCQAKQVRARDMVPVLGYRLGTFFP